MSEDKQQPNGDFLKNYSNVTRVEVITSEGREFVRYDCSNVQVSLQDEGRTLKVFLKQGQISEEFGSQIDWITTELREEAADA